MNSTQIGKSNRVADHGIRDNVGRFIGSLSFWDFTNSII